jgi:DNA-binding NarL/FixJ family response regulator
VLTTRNEEVAHPIAGRRLAILQAVLRGLPQTNVAIDLKLAPSTVALNSKLGLESLGVPGKPSRVHPLLMLAAVAASEPCTTTFRSSSFALAERSYRVVAASRPDRHLARILPTAELAVIRRLVEGSSYAEIATERGTSTRTIANQVTAVFRRLRVSGRNELLHRLLVGEGLIHPLPEPPPPPPVRAVAKRGEPWQQARRSA